jgi:starch phosphorylase
LCQEALLGLGGVAILSELGHDRIRIYHMNEGHSALLALALLEEKLAGRGTHSVRETDVDAVRRHCVFTTHTPVPAAMDHYPWDLVQRAGH